MSELALSPMRRIIKKAIIIFHYPQNIHWQIGRGACKQLAKELEKIGLELAQEAVNYMTHAGRQTLQEEDIQAVIRRR